MNGNNVHEQRKLSNKRKVLQCIMKNSPVSRADIAAKLYLSKPTVSLLVDELIQDNWVIEQGIGEASSQGGRRPIHLYFNEKAAYVAGADIGGTKVKIVICDLGGNIIATSSISTVQYLESGLLKQIAKELRALMDEHGINEGEILGMGAGVPGITDAKNGIVVEAPSLNWVRYPFVDEAARHFPFPVFVDNDVNVAALGEQWLGNATQKDNILFIAVGTGIGSGIIINNQLYRGYANAAGEIGYLVTDKNDMKNEFTPIFHRYGYLESVAGGKAIGRVFTEEIRKNPEHPLYEQAQKGELPGESAFLQAKAGDPAALKVIDNAIEHLAYGVINTACILNPEVIIFGGGVFKSYDYILPKLSDIVNHYVPSSVELKLSKLGQNAGILGAVSLFLREHESIIQY